MLLLLIHCIYKLCQSVVEQGHGNNKAYFFRATPHFGGKGQDRRRRCAAMQLHRDARHQRLINTAQQKHTQRVLHKVHNQGHRHRVVMAKRTTKQ